MIRRTIAGLAAAAAIACFSAAAVSVAHATSYPGTAEWIQYVVRSDGSSGVGLAGYPAGVSAAVTHCTPVAGCTRLLGSPDVREGVAVPADAQPGDFFLVHRSDALPATTVPWQGPLHATAPPTVNGTARVGSEVHAAAGQWSGGFGREQSSLQLQACRDAAGSDCVNIGGHYSGTLECDARAVIPQRFTGWYLRAAERRESSHVASTLALPLSPETVGAIAAGPATSLSETVGPIEAGPAPRGRACVPPPARAAEFRFRARAGREQGELTVARVRCAETCAVHATLRRGARSATVKLVASYGRWTRVALTPRMARRLGAGTLKLRVTVTDGRPNVPQGERSVVLARRMLKSVARRR